MRVRGSNNTLCFPPPNSRTVILSRTESTLSMVPPTSVASTLGTGGNSGNRVAGSTATVLSSESSAIDGFRGSIAPSALVPALGEIIAEEEGSAVTWALRGLPTRTQPAATTTQVDILKILNAVFTPQLDANRRF